MLEYFECLSHLFYLQSTHYRSRRESISKGLSLEASGSPKLYSAHIKNLTSTKYSVMFIGQSGYCAMLRSLLRVVARKLISNFWWRMQRVPVNILKFLRLPEIWYYILIIICFPFQVATTIPSRKKIILFLIITILRYVNTKVKQVTSIQDHY